LLSDLPPQCNEVVPPTRPPHANASDRIYGFVSKEIIQAAGRTSSARNPPIGAVESETLPP
jgi:hypothetical protein